MSVAIEGSASSLARAAAACLKTFFGNARPVGHALNDETISVFFAIKNLINILAWDTE